jgi:hypothetical protein
MLRSPQLSFSFIIAAALAIAPVLGTTAGAQNVPPPSIFITLGTMAGPIPAAQRSAPICW